ncbi:MAG: IclR family transcriptional regulator [Nocardioidaceae bacterium]
MPAQVPAAQRALRVLALLAAQSEPVTLDHISRALAVPRSSMYQLVNVMVAEGFVTHLEDDHRYGLGLAAFEVGSGYTRQAPLQRLARRPLASLVDELGESAHLATLRGADVIYVLEERAPGKPSLVTDVGITLPAHLTASGRAILARLPAAQVRAQFPAQSSFVSRTGTGPSSLTALTSLLAATRQRGWATEDGDVTTGFASIAVAVLDAAAHPVAAVAVTYETGSLTNDEDAVRRVSDTAAALARRLRGRQSGPPPPPDRSSLA